MCNKFLRNSTLQSPILKIAKIKLYLLGHFSRFYSWSAALDYSGGRQTELFLCSERPASSGNRPYLRGIPPGAPISSPSVTGYHIRLNSANKTCSQLGHLSCFRRPFSSRLLEITADVFVFGLCEIVAIDYTNFVFPPLFLKVTSLSNRGGSLAKLQIEASDKRWLQIRKSLVALLWNVLITLVSNRSIRFVKRNKCLAPSNGGPIM